MAGWTIIECPTLPYRRQGARVHAEVCGNQMMVSPELVAVMRQLHASEVGSLTGNRTPIA